MDDAQELPIHERAEIELSEIVHRAVDRSYEDLYALTRKLQHEKDAERRDSILNYIHSTRKRLIQLLVLIKWSVQSPLVHQCRSLLEKAHFFSNFMNETNDRLFFMHADLNRAKERKYDIHTAVNVLYGGTYFGLPTIIETAMMPRPLPTANAVDIAAELDDILHFKILETKLPEQFTHVSIENGFLKCEVEKEFELVFTVQGKEVDSKWRLVCLTTKLESTSFSSTSSPTAGSDSSSSSQPTAEHYGHLRNIIQSRLNVSDEPLVEAFTIMREFCSCLALDVLYAQSEKLMEKKWKNRVTIDYDRDHNVLDLCYWKDQHEILFGTPAASAGTQDSTNNSRITASNPHNCFRVRMTMAKPGKTHLIYPSFFPELPPEVLSRCTIQDLRSSHPLSIERILLGAMQAHASLALYSLQQRMTIISQPSSSCFCAERPLRAKLITGEAIEVTYSASSLRLRRTDLPNLTACLEISVNLRKGQFESVVTGIAQHPQMAAATAVRQLQDLLQSPPVLAIEKNKNNSSPVASKNPPSHESSSSYDFVLQSALREALREIFADEIARVGQACIGITAERNIPLDWDKFIEYRIAQGNDVRNLNLDKALFFQLASNVDYTYYLVVESDRRAMIDESLATKVPRAGGKKRDPKTENVPTEALWIQSPTFSLLHVDRRKSNVIATVQYLQRFSAFYRPEFELESHPSHELMLAAVARCTTKVRLQHFITDARRLKVRVKMLGDGSTRSGESTSGRVLAIQLPDQFSTSPLDLESLVVHLQPKGGLQVVVKLRQLPFTSRMAPSMVQRLKEELPMNRNSSHPVLVKDEEEEEEGGSSLDKKRKRNYDGALCPNPLKATPKREMLSERELLFSYPANQSFWFGRPNRDIPLDLFLKDLVYEVRPLVRFAMKLEHVMHNVLLRKNPRESNNSHDNHHSALDGLFYLEHMDPFRIILVSRCVNARKTIAAGGTMNQVATFRLTITYTNQAFVLQFASPMGVHPLLTYIQAALNVHQCPRQLLEAIERSTIPLTILSSFVESKLLSVKYHRQLDPSLDEIAQGNVSASSHHKESNLPVDPATTSTTGPSPGEQKSAGKSMKLGYKGKFGGKGMRLGYTSDKTLVGLKISSDDRGFVPCELVLIPRSQIRVKLAYSNRCSVDVWFLADRFVLIKSVSLSGIPVPSCATGEGQKIPHHHFAQKIEAICTEMATL